VYLVIFVISTWCLQATLEVWSSNVRLHIVFTVNSWNAAFRWHFLIGSWIWTGIRVIISVFCLISLISIKYQRDPIFLKVICWLYFFVFFFNLFFFYLDRLCSLIVRFSDLMTHINNMSVLPIGIYYLGQSLWLCILTNSQVIQVLLNYNNILPRNKFFHLSFLHFLLILT
jgi:hypothetical protein